MSHMGFVLMLIVIRYLSYNYNTEEVLIGTMEAFQEWNHTPVI